MRGPDYFGCACGIIELGSGAQVRLNWLQRGCSAIITPQILEVIMSIQQQIEERLTQSLSPTHLTVVNESHQHNVPANSETHFKVVAVSPAFQGKRQVARHQLIYGALAEQLAGPVHALALHTYSPEEWQLREGDAPESPDCLGGSGGA
jgi:BolA protein